MANKESQSERGNFPVGQQLQQAREAKGLSVAQIADAQHLRPSIINAIESGHYEQIDTELFLKGYIRAYARQVGLDGNALIAHLNVEMEPLRRKQAQDKAANPLVNMAQRRRKKRQTAKAVLWLIALAAAGFLLFSLIYNPAQLASLPGASALTDIGKDSSDNADPDADASGSSQASAVDNRSEPALSNERETGAGSAPLVPSDALEPLASAGNSVATDQSADAVTDSAQGAVTADNPTPALADNRGRLEIEFTDDCWIQIRDANGDSLVSGLKRRNDSIDVQADSDIRLVIGAASAVGSMRFQGESVDLSSKRVIGNRAEFTLTVD